MSRFGRGYRSFSTASNRSPKGVQCVWTTIPSSAASDMVVKFLLLSPNSWRRLLIVGSLTPNIADGKTTENRENTPIVVSLCYSVAVLDVH